MKALHAEMKLRDETRELEQSRKALEDSEYEEKAIALSLTQGEIEGDVRLTVADIMDLDNARQFQKEIGMLRKVAEVMNEAEVILGEPNTGRDTVGAETEAIEILLAAKRSGGGGGGGGGGSPGGGGGGTTSRAALANLGPGKDLDSEIQKRDIEQSTGTAGRELPAEFRDGLDAYFNELEDRKGG